jgi:hypothetical protein
VRPHAIDQRLRRDRVAQTHARERRDLGERARDDHRPPFEHVWHRRRVARILDEMVIGLVDQHRQIGGHAVEEQRDVLFRHDDAGRIVRIAQVHEAQIAIVRLDGPDHRRNVLRVIVPQRQLDGVGLDARRVLVHRAV